MNWTDWQNAIEDERDRLGGPTPFYTQRKEGYEECLQWLVSLETEWRVEVESAVAEWVVTGQWVEMEPQVHFLIYLRFQAALDQLEALTVSPIRAPSIKDQTLIRSWLLRDVWENREMLWHKLMALRLASVHETFYGW